MGDARGHALNRKSCLGRKLSDLTLTLTLMVNLTLPSFAELREESCLAGMGLVSRKEKPKRGSASSGCDYGSGRYSWGA